jgi:hypothetical protein
MGHSDDRTTAPSRHGHWRGFLAGLVLAGLVAVFWSATNTTAPVVPTEAPVTVTTPPVETLEPDTDPAPISFERAAARTALESCARRSVDAAPMITPPEGAVALAAANFPADLGFGPIVVHLPLPGSAYLHVLRSDTPLPVTGAVDLFAAPLVVDAELTRALGAESIAVGISAPFRAAFPAGWLPRFTELLTGCLTSSVPPASPALPSFER